MRLIKKIDIFVFKAYSLLFVGTFFVCLFIFMMQLMWRWIDDLIGKGLTLDVLARFFYYSGLTLIPVSLPLAILLASLITFGNLGERFELLSMKAAGIPLIRILRPIIILTLLMCGCSFYFQNVICPAAQKKFYTVGYSMKQKSPELEIPEGVFYNEIPGYNIFVEQKSKKEDGMLYGVMIYSTTDGYEDSQIVLADSARLQTTADEQHLRLTMYSGERFRNMQSQGGVMARTSVPYMRETFVEETDLIPFDNNFNMTDANLFSGSAMTKNMREIQAGIDSLTLKSDSTGQAVYTQLLRTTYVRKTNIGEKDSAAIAGRRLTLDTLYSRTSAEQRLNILRHAMQKTSSATTEYEFRSLISKDIDQSIRVHKLEWHKKFTLSLACLFFFFIGAPLGAIIRKGGLGVPVVISVVLFIFYYIINAAGEKLARAGEWEVWFGEWLSSMVLCPVSIFLTYKANKDSSVFNIEAYTGILRRLLGLRTSRHIARKEVIIYDPDYTAARAEALSLAEAWQDYAGRKHLRRPPGYIDIFFRQDDDTEAAELNERLETLVATLANSRDAILLELLNRLPVISVGDHMRPFRSARWNMVPGVLLPVGALLYLRIWRCRLRLYADIQQIGKCCAQLTERMTQLISNEQ